jgi:hypothetical protein
MVLESVSGVENRCNTSWASAGADSKRFGAPVWPGNGSKPKLVDRLLHGPFWGGGMSHVQCAMCCRRFWCKVLALWVGCCTKAAAGDVSRSCGVEKSYAAGRSGRIPLPRVAPDQIRESFGLGRPGKLRRIRGRRSAASIQTVAPGLAT